jgi:hypothetical protein
LDDFTLDNFLKSTLTGGIPTDSEMRIVSEQDGGVTVTTRETEISPKSFLPRGNAAWPETLRKSLRN